MVDHERRDQSWRYCFIFEHDSKISSTYQYGLVVAVEFGSDGLVRCANVRYKNSFNSFCETRRSTRTLVVMLMKWICSMNLGKTL